MIRIHRLALSLLLLSLVACDQAPAPQPAKPKAVEPATEPVAPAAPAEPVAAPAKPAAVSKPAAAAVVVTKPQPAAKPVTPAAKAKPPATTKPQVDEAKAALDLSLPAEVFDQLPPLEPASEPPKALLPPLFGEKSASESPFQLNGKLITNERVDDYWESLEGAELQFEFKR